jgi:hypothetical protein
MASLYSSYKTFKPDTSIRERERENISNRHLVSLTWNMARWHTSSTHRRGLLHLTSSFVVFITVLRLSAVLCRLSFYSIPFHRVLHRCLFFASCFAEEQESAWRFPSTLTPVGEVLVSFPEAGLPNLPNTKVILALSYCLSKAVYHICWNVMHRTLPPTTSPKTLTAHGGIRVLSFVLRIFLEDTIKLSLFFLN